MSRKPARTTRSRAESSTPGDGMVAELIDRIFENPAMSGGLMVVALTATAIISNAMFLQDGHHPDPLFTTRAQIENPVTAKTARVPKPPAARPAAIPPASIVVVPPLPRLAPVVRPPAALAAASPSSDAQLITSVQRELARLGLYSGVIDGLSGSRTAAAISAYEKAAGLAVTGQPTADLLTAMQQPLPKPAAGTITATNAEYTAAAGELDRRERARADAIAAEQQARADAQMQENYRIVQGALNRIGYGPLPVDGAASPETADAIRRFELDTGLPISGEASDTLIGKLIAIGAIKTT